jgi:hypothetical protein
LKRIKKIKKKPGWKMGELFKIFRQLEKLLTLLIDSIELKNKNIFKNKKKTI